MGIVSGISKVVTYIPKAVKYGYRGVKASPYIIFGKGADAFVKAAGSVSKAADESWLTAAKKAIKAGGKAVEATKGKGNIFVEGWKALKSMPRTIALYAKKGGVEAGLKGSNKILGNIKGAFKGLGKKMPLIGNLMLVGFELPNIFKAVKEQGIGQGIAEVGKAGARLTGASLGAAIGSAVLPGLGSLIGWVAGEWLVSKVVGKSYSEKVAEKEEKAKEDMERLAELQQAQQQSQVQQTAPQTSNISMQGGMTYPQNNSVTNPFNSFNLNQYSNPYANDIMMQQINFDQLA
jgi:hypothetical protein